MLPVYCNPLKAKFVLIKTIYRAHQILFLLSLDISEDNYFNDNSPKDRDNMLAVGERNNHRERERLVRLPTVSAANRHFL